MKQNPDLIRLLLLQLEGTSVDLSSHSSDDILYHKALAKERGLANGIVHFLSRTHSEIPDRVHLSSLTPEGHDFLEQVRSDTMWARAKSFAIEKGWELTFESCKKAVQILFASVMK